MIPATATAARRLLEPERLRKLLPWPSLVLGVLGAFLMDRRPEQAGLVAAAAVGGWGILVVLPILRRLTRQRSSRWVRAADLVAVATSINLLQQALFFVLPFYFRAAELSAGHVVFLLVLGALALASLWDPLCEAVLARPVASIPVQLFSTFVALAAVLPILGLPGIVSLPLAGLLAALGLPLVAMVHAPEEARCTAGRRALGASLALPVLLAIPPLRAMIPAAPLRLAGATIGTRVEAREVADPAERLEQVPPQLACATAIAAPRGLKDRLFHVWLHEGDVVDRIPLDVRGGREEGFRTYSVKRNLGPAPQGTWTCAVETRAGQRLGSTSVEIGG